MLLVYVMMVKGKKPYIAEASQYTGNRVTGSINARNEVHAWADPVERPYNCKLHTVLSSLRCQNYKTNSRCN